MNKKFQLASNPTKRLARKEAQVLLALKEVILEVSPELKSFEDRISIHLPNDHLKDEVL